MKYSEFKQEIEKLGYGTISQIPYGHIFILDKGASVGSVSVKDEHICETFKAYRALSKENRKDVLELISKLTLTPLAEREEEKRYRLLNVSPMLRKSECGYLLYHREYDKYYTGNTDHWGLVYQTIFTESEIAEMDITGFEKVEVTE